MQGSQLHRRSHSMFTFPYSILPPTQTGSRCCFLGWIHVWSRNVQELSDSFSHKYSSIGCSCLNYHEDLYQQGIKQLP